VYAIFERGVSAAVARQQGLRPVAARVHGNYFSHASACDFIFDHSVFGFEPQYLAYHQSPAGRPGGGNHLRAVVKIERQRFLDEDVLLVFESERDRVEVRLLWSDYVDRVKRGIGADLFYGLRNFRNVEFSGDKARTFGISIKYRRNFGVTYGAVGL